MIRAGELGEKQSSLHTRGGSRRPSDLVCSGSDVPPRCAGAGGMRRAQVPGQTRGHGDREAAPNTNTRPLGSKGHGTGYKCVSSSKRLPVFLLFPEFCSSKGFLITD